MALMENNNFKKTRQHFSKIIYFFNRAFHTLIILESSNVGGPGVLCHSLDGRRVALVFVLF